VSSHCVRIAGGPSCEVRGEGDNAGPRVLARCRRGDRARNGCGEASFSTGSLAISSPRFNHLHAYACSNPVPSCEATPWINRVGGRSCARASSMIPEARASGINPEARSPEADPNTRKCALSRVCRGLRCAFEASSSRGDPRMPQKKTALKPYCYLRRRRRRNA